MRTAAMIDSTDHAEPRAEDPTPFDSGEVRLGPDGVEHVWRVRRSVERAMFACDLKSIAAVAFSSYLLATTYGTIRSLAWRIALHGRQWHPFLDIAAFVVLIAAVAFGVLSLGLRLRSQRGAGSATWDGIAAHHRPVAFWHDLTGLAGPDTGEHLVRSLYTLCETCRDRHFWLALSVWSAVVGGGLRLVSLLFSQVI